METDPRTAQRPDVFTHVHKGLRKALFELAAQTGATHALRPSEVENLRQKAGEVFHFLSHHAQNEDRFLLPEMEALGLTETATIRAEHGRLEGRIESLQKALASLSGAQADLDHFYLDLSRFISEYLTHLDDEESRLLPRLLASMDDAQLSLFAQRSVASTAPHDQIMMLGYMFKAMHAGEIDAFFQKLRQNNPPPPAEFISRLESLAQGG